MHGKKYFYVPEDGEQSTWSWDAFFFRTTEFFFSPIHSILSILQLPNITPLVHTLFPSRPTSYLSLISPSLPPFSLPRFCDRQVFARWERPSPPPPPPLPSFTELSQSPIHPETQLQFLTPVSLLQPSSLFVHPLQGPAH